MDSARFGRQSVNSGETSPLRDERATFRRLGRRLLPVCLAALAAAMLLVSAPASRSAPGDTIDNSGLIPYDQAYFAFEVEGVLATLKEVPNWDDIERMLDNPYELALDPSVGGNYQGWPSYRLTQPRARSFVYRLNGDTSAAGAPCAPGSAGCVEVPLPRLVIHPLNYNHMNGEELRLLNPAFVEAPWQVPDQLVLVEASNTDPTKGPLGVGRYEYTYRDVTVSAGATRIEDDEAAPDFNSPIAPDAQVCIVTAEAPWGPDLGPFAPGFPGVTTIPEGSIICGGDPGEPGFLGFGTLAGNAISYWRAYSTPAFPLAGSPATRNPARDITAGFPALGQGSKRLFDPAGCDERNAESPGACEPGSGNRGGFINRLRKPTLRATPSAPPNYLLNSEAELIDRAADEGEGPENAQAFLLASNENDYFRGNSRAEKVAARNVAAALGKALFWDMQVGSDGVQACASCHFHAGADDRSKNQINPDHLGGDLNIDLHGGLANQQLTVADFPFHKLADVQNAGECADPGAPGTVDQNCANVVSHVNDVASSMGVVFSPFTDIPAIGTFVGDSGVNVVMPDLRTAAAADPIPVFQGLRRVEPRNTPTFLASTLNFDNFWDGRARHDFNGGSVFGPSDPQAHVMVDEGGSLVATRQIIRFASLASLATGPALSEFEMSFQGRSWAKIGKKLLQPGATPLANQLVAADDSIMGAYSNQGGSWCAANGRPTAAGKPGLCASYNELIQMAFYDSLWSNTGMHLEGCYTDNLASHLNQCAPGGVAVPVLAGGTVVAGSADPFDNYVLGVAQGAAAAADTNQFTQMEANMPLFFGLAVHAWTTVLVPYDTPMDRFYDQNPDVFKTFGESNERFLVPDLLTCGDINPTSGTPQTNDCVTEVGNFKRDPGLIAVLNCTVETCDNPEMQQVAVSGTRQPGDPDPLLGMDFFLGSNLSLKNPNFRSLRCGECHAGATLTDHTVEISHQLSFNDWVAEFSTGQPGVGLFPEPLGRSRIISGFALEGELQENAQDAVERNIADLCTVEPCVDAHGNPVPTTAQLGGPQGQALFDNGVYNIGVTPTANDVSRGGADGFGWPLSLSRLALKNLCGVDYSSGGDDITTDFAQPLGPSGVGIPCPTFDPAVDFSSGGLFEPSAQDQQINPGFGEEPADPQLPPFLAKWASNINVGDEVQQDEVFFGINTRGEQPILEGFVDSFGPFNPAAIIGETMNMSVQAQMSTWPNVNRVNVQGAFKAPPLRNIALTGPYFHNGGKLTLRQQLDFYMRGGDFPKSNAAHRDFLIANMRIEDEALGGVDPITGETLFTEEQKEQIIRAVVDFLLELTDERVAYSRAPFDNPEIFVPLDGAAPDNTFGRSGLLARTTGDCNGVAGAGACFERVPETGAGGTATPLQNFLGVTNIRPGETGFNCDPAAGPISHYCP